MRVHPGCAERKPVFYVKNTTDRPMVGQAIPSVVPLTATDYFPQNGVFLFRTPRCF